MTLFLSSPPRAARQMRALAKKRVMPENLRLPDAEEGRQMPGLEVQNG